MDFFNSFPWQNSHQLNLDWVLNHTSQLLRDFEEFKAVNTVTFGGVWDIQKNYPAWTIVSRENEAYISLKPVRPGIPLENTNYWVLAADLDPRIAGLVAEVAKSFTFYPSITDMVEANHAVNKIVATPADNTLQLWEIKASPGALSVPCKHELYAVPYITTPVQISGLSNSQDITALLTTLLSNNFNHIIMPSDRRTISGPVRLPNNTKIENGAITLTASGLFDASAVSNVTINNLDIVCADNHSAEYAILVYDSKNVTIRNTTVVNSGGIGIGFSRSNNCTCDSCTVSNSRNWKPGFWSNYEETFGVNHQFINCTAFGNQLDGFLINSQNTTLTNCIAYSNGLKTPPDGALGACGIYCDHSSDLKLEGCKCFDNGESGINIKGNSLTILDCTCHDNFLEGIKIRESSSDILIATCYCYENGRYMGSANPLVWRRSGICFLMNVQGLLLEGNVSKNIGVKNTQSFGIDYAYDPSKPQSSKVIAVGNFTQYNTTDGHNFGSDYSGSPLKHYVEAANLW